MAAITATTTYRLQKNVDVSVILCTTDGAGDFTVKHGLVGRPFGVLLEPQFKESAAPGGAVISFDEEEINFHGVIPGGTYLFYVIAAGAHKSIVSE